MLSMSSMLVITALLLVAGTVHTAPSDHKCGGPDTKCRDSSDCCGGCCHEHMCALSPEACVTSATSPCYLHACPAGKVCYLAQVECLQPPCEPATLPACRPADTDYY